MKHRRSWWNKRKERIVLSLYCEDERGKERNGRPKEKQTSQGVTDLGEVWKMALSPYAVGAELAVCQFCSGRMAEKDGDDGKDAAARSSSEREQMDGEDSTKVETAQRSRQHRNEKRREEIEVHIFSLG